MSTSNKPNIGYWIIAIIALIWNGMGVMAYIGQAYMTDEALALLPDNEQALYADIPAWATAAFAIAVFAGALGALALLLRKKWAKPLFLLSLLGIIVHQIYNFFVSDAMEVYGTAGMIMPAIVIIAGIFLLWYSKKSIAKGWLR